MIKELCKVRLKKQGGYSIDQQKLDWYVVEQKVQGQSEMLAHMLIIAC